jgi:outer membrane protein assembly factor BamB
MTFPAGTLIVPMQTAFRVTSGDVLLAHGMLYRLLQRDGVVAYRAIDGDKAGVNVPDFTVKAAAGPVVENYHGTSAPDNSTVSYLGGAWLIAPQYQDDVDAILADPTWANVQIHRAAVPFTAPVTTVRQLSARPIALLVSEDDVEAARARAAMEWFLTPTGLAAAFGNVTPGQISAGALVGPDAPAVLLVPYAQPLQEVDPALADDVLSRLHGWLAAGHTLIAQDDAVAYLENQVAGRFLTTEGIAVNGVVHDDRSQNRVPPESIQLALAPGNMVGQIGDQGEFGAYCAEGRPCVPATDGLVRNFRPYQANDGTLSGYGQVQAGSEYRPTVRRLHAWNADGSGYQWDLAVVGHPDGLWGNGSVVHLGGRLVPDAAAQGSGSNYPQISTALHRIFLNALYLTEAAAPLAQVVHAGVTVDRDLIEFKGSTSTGDGRGHLEAFDAANDPATLLWDAAEQIPADASRRILTLDGTALTDVTSGNAFVSSLLGRQEIERLRGRTVDTTGVYQNLANRLGAIDRSTSVAVGPSSLVDGAEARGRNVYVGTLDGLLEAVDANPANGEPAGTGAEMWALVPRCQIDRLAADGLDAHLGVDGSPTVADLWIDHDGSRTFRTVLTVPMGASSPHILALDISDRENPEVLWEITDHGAVNMGFANKTAMGHIAEPDGDGNLVRTAVVWVATSKYRQNDGGGLSLYSFRAEDGVKLWEFHQAYASGVNDVPPPVVAVDPDGDGFVETVFAGDNEGRLWAVNARTGKSLYCNDAPICASPVPLYIGDPTQPIGAAPAVVAEGGQMIVLFGTGGFDWAPAETVVQHFVGLLVPTQGASLELFNIALDPGDRVYASPVIDRHAHYLFLGKTHGRAGGGATPPDTDATATVETYDISNALYGHAGVPSKSGDDMVLTQALPGGLQLEGGVLFGSTADGGGFHVGDLGGAAAVPRPEPLTRLYWRVVP